jgi:xanthine/CO dehydrogenase XdhC/CoxF family maturation factor
MVIMGGVKEILPEIEAWKKEGERIVVATVVATRRSAPRPIGASLAISESGKMCGSVSGGCVESDVYENAQEVFETGEPKLLSYGISDDLAWSVGLPCGGEIDVFVEPVE